MSWYANSEEETSFLCLEHYLHSDHMWIYSLWSYDSHVAKDCIYCRRYSFHIYFVNAAASSKLGRMRDTNQDAMLEFQMLEKNSSMAFYLRKK